MSCWSCWVAAVSGRAAGALPSAGRSPRRARGPGRPRAAHRTRCTIPGNRPCTAAGTVVRAPPRPAAGARGRAGRPRAGWSRRRGRGRRAPRPCRAGRVDVELLQRHVDLVLDLLQAPYALPLERGRGRAREQHALHDRLQPQVELDRRSFGDSEDFDAKFCWRRDGGVELTLGPRAAAELARIEHERRPRVQAAHANSHIWTPTQPRNRIRRPTDGAKRVTGGSPSLGPASTASGPALGEPRDELLAHGLGDQAAYVAPERRDLLDQARGDERVPDGAGEEHGLDRGEVEFICAIGSSYS